MRSSRNPSILGVCDEASNRPSLSPAEGAHLIPSAPLAVVGCLRRSGWTSEIMSSRASYEGSVKDVRLRGRRRVAADHRWPYRYDVSTSLVDEWIPSLHPA